MRSALPRIVTVFRLRACAIAANRRRAARAASCTARERLVARSRMNGRHI
jgi:hypothetical protein